VKVSNGKVEEACNPNEEGEYNDKEQELEHGVGVMSNGDVAVDGGRNEGGQFLQNDQITKVLIESSHEILDLLVEADDASKCDRSPVGGFGSLFCNAHELVETSRNAD
jgi:hypothetical protein